MAELKIIHWPDSILLKKSRAITDLEFQTGAADGISLPKLVADMMETMYKTKGVGLAAPQVGISLKLCVVDASKMKPEYPGLTMLFNPEIKSQIGSFEAEEEGCLSFPEIFAVVRRKLNIIVAYQNIKGESQELHWIGYPSRVLLHELDHLDGVVFINRLDAVARAQLREKLDLLQDEFQFLQRKK